MADFMVEVIDNRVEVSVGGSELLLPLVAKAAGAASTAAAASGSIAGAIGESGFDAANATALTIGTLTPNDDTVPGTGQFVFGGSAFTAGPAVISAFGVRLSAGGSGQFLIVSRWGKVLAVTDVVSLAAGTNSYSGFAPIYVPPGHSVFYNAVSGGKPRYIAAGTSMFFDDSSGAAEAGDTVAFTASGSTIAVSMSGIALPETLALRADAMAGILGLKETMLGTTAPDDDDIVGPAIAVAADPVPARGVVTALTMRVDGLVSGYAVVLNPLGDGSYRADAMVPLILTDGVATYPIPPVPVEPGAAVGFLYAPFAGGVSDHSVRFALGGRTLSFPQILTPGEIVTPNAVQDAYTPAIAYTLRSSALAVPKISRTAIAGPSPRLVERFTAAAPGGWILGDDVVSGAPGLVGSGSDVTQVSSRATWIGPDGGGYSYANQRLFESQWQVSNANGAFGLMTTPHNGSRGTAIFVNGATGTMQLFECDAAGPVTAGPFVALTAALTTHDYALSVVYEKLKAIVTLTDLRSGAATVLTDDFAVTPNLRGWHGRVSVAPGTGVTCRGIDMSAGRPTYLRTVIVGDSIAEGPTAASTNPSWAHHIADNRGDILISARAGHTVADALRAFGQDVEAARPDNVVLALGSNDAIANQHALWRVGMAQAVGRVLGAGARPVLTTLPPIVSCQPVLNAMNADVMGGYFGDFEFIDLAAAVSLGNDRVTPDPAKYHADGIHLVQAGALACAAQAQAQVPYISR